MKIRIIVIICILIVLILLIAVLIGKNYYAGKQFHKDSSSNIVHYFSFYLPSNSLVDKCMHYILKYGTKLNSSKNFNNANGYKMNYNIIKQYIPEIIYFYMNEVFKQLVEDTIKIKLNFAPLTEKYRFFLRLYLDGDFLDYHYDNNFTKSRRFTAVIPILVNEENTSEFQVKCKDCTKIYKIPISEGVLYNGSKIYHSISKQSKNGVRMVIVIPMYEDYTLGFIGRTRKKIRDITYKQLSL